MSKRVADLGRFVLCSRLPGPAISSQPGWSMMLKKSRRQDGACFQGRRRLHTRKQLSTVPSLDLRDIPQSWVAPAPWSVLDLALLHYRPPQHYHAWVAGLHLHKRISHEISYLCSQREPQKSGRLCGVTVWEVCVEDQKQVAFLLTDWLLQLRVSEEQNLFVELKLPVTGGGGGGGWQEVGWMWVKKVVGMVAWRTPWVMNSWRLLQEKPSVFTVLTKWWMSSVFFY